MREKIMCGEVAENRDGGKTVWGRQSVANHGQMVRRMLAAVGGILWVIILLGLMAAPVQAQSYPTQSVRFIVPFPPGGGTDFTARVIGPKLAERLGQPVILENRAGAGGNVGSEYVAKAKPDGYTIGIVTVDISPSPNLYKKLNYDPTKDFAPVSLVAQNPLVMLVRPSHPAKTLKEFVAYAKANPGKVNYGSSGMGGLGHLAGELLKSLAKIDMVHAPYKGAGPALVGLMGNEIDMTVVSAASAMPHVLSGKARAVAALGKQRIASLPDVPTSKEAGVDGFDALWWAGIVAPAGTPRDIVNRLNAEWIKIAAMADVKEQIRKGGLEPASSTPEDFSAFIKEDVALWGKVIKEANIPQLD